MTTASELLLAYLNNVKNAKVASALFAADGAIELPYLTTLGFPWRAEGPEEIRQLLELNTGPVTDFTFHDIKILIDLPDQVFGEWEVTSTVRSSGKPFHQLYTGRLVAEAGKIKLLRETLDTLARERSFS
jgi:ketosteroid isomerase-like protein